MTYEQAIVEAFPEATPEEIEWVLRVSKQYGIMNRADPIDTVARYSLARLFLQAMRVRSA